MVQNFIHSCQPTISQGANPIVTMKRMTVGTILGKRWENPSLRRPDHFAGEAKLRADQGGPGMLKIARGL